MKFDCVTGQEWITAEEELMARWNVWNQLSDSSGKEHDLCSSSEGPDR